MQFEIEILAEFLLKAQGERFRLLVIVGKDRLRNVPRDTGGKADQPLFMQKKRFEIDPRLVIIPVAEGDGIEQTQITIAGFVLAKQDQVVQFLLGRFIGKIAANIKFRAENGLYVAAFCVTGVEKRHGAVHIAVVGHGKRGHLQLIGAFHHLRNARSSVEQAVFGMNV